MDTGLGSFTSNESAERTIALVKTNSVFNSRSSTISSVEEAETAFIFSGEILLQTLSAC